MVYGEFFYKKLTLVNYFQESRRTRTAIFEMTGDGLVILVAVQNI